MESNVSLNSSEDEICKFGVAQFTILSLIDIITFLMGQPVLTKLLWITFTSKKNPDILNCNLALFHNLQNLVSILHLFVLFLLPEYNQEILHLLFVYAQIGGPMSLTFICLERYVAVIHPTSYPLLKKYRCREVCAVMVWVFSVPTAFVTVLAADHPSSLTEKILTIFANVVMVVMIAVMVQCSSGIARALRKSSPGRDDLHPVKRRALTIVRATCIITFLFYFPVTALQRYGYHDKITYDCIVTPTCIFLLSTASVVHPLCYLSTQGKLFTC